MLHSGKIARRDIHIITLLALIIVRVFGMHGTLSARTIDSQRYNALQVTPCPDMLAPRLQIGKIGRVIPGNAINIRDKPNAREGQVLGKMVSDDTFTVLEGPECSRSFTWWKINFNGVVGWSIEAEGKKYVLEPINRDAPTTTPFATATIDPAAPPGATAENQPTATTPATPTAGPSLTPSPTFTITPIPTSPIGVTCNGALPSRLIAGDKGRVRPEANQNHVRETANGFGTLLGFVPVDSVFLVEEGPKCADETAWYKVRYENLVGWMAESQRDVYNLAPIPPASGVALCSESPITEIANAPATTAAKGEIVYIDGTNNLALISLDGKYQQRLTTNGIAESPVWSPDGTRIALVWRGHIAVANADGSDLKEISPFTGNSPTWAPDGQRILFASDVDGNIDLYFVTVDGAKACRLTRTPQSELKPALSRDGRMIAYVLKEGNTSYVYTMALDGTNIKRVTVDHNTADNPAWSADGSKLAYTALEKTTNRFQLFVINADGTEAKALTESFDGATLPSWSPDGRYIVYVQNGMLAAAYVEGKGQQPLTYPPTYGRSPDWLPIAPDVAIALMPSPTLSPTPKPLTPTVTPTPTVTLTPTTSPFVGKGRLVFSYGSIYTVNADGKGWRNLTEKLTHGSEPVWSPDATKIAFISSFDGDAELYVMNADGSDIRQLTSNNISDMHPGWSSDGKQIIYISNLSGKSQLWIIGSDGRNRHRAFDEVVLSADWSPDGNRIVYESGEGSQLFVADIDGKNAVPLGVTGNNPNWSPDGKRIVYIVNSQLYLINADSSDNQPLSTEKTGSTARPNWSPDGEYVTYQHADGGIFALNVSTGAQVHLLPEWRSPDLDWTN